jgi:hypothetical protein
LDILYQQISTSSLLKYTLRGLLGKICNPLKHEKRGRRECGEISERRNTQRGETEKNVPALKVHMQYPIILPVEVRLSKGKALGSEAGKCLENGVYYEG